MSSMRDDFSLSDLLRTFANSCQEFNFAGDFFQLGIIWKLLNSFKN